MTGGKINRNTQEEIKRIQKNTIQRFRLLVSSTSFTHSLNTTQNTDITRSTPPPPPLMNQMIRHRVAL